MATTDVRKSVIGIVNEVQRRLGISTTTSLTANRHANTLLDLLNDTIDEISDYGDWQQMFREVNVTAATSVGTYAVEASANVKNIYEIHWDDDVSPLEVRTIEDMRRLQRLTSFGVPRQFAVVGASGVNPKVRVYPVPGSNQNTKLFDVAFYKKPRLLTTTDVSAVPAFPARLLVQGLYAKALLEENSGEPTPQYQVAELKFAKMLSETHNRLTADTGTDLYLTPTASRYA